MHVAVEARSGHYPGQQKRSEWSAPVAPLGSSEVDLLGQRQGVIDLHAEISNRAFELGVSQEELHGAEVTGLPVDHRHLGSP